MHRVTHKYITRKEGNDIVRYEVGDAFEPSDAELESFGDRLELAGAEPAEEGENPGGNAPESGFDPAEYTISELKDELDDGEYDLDAIEAVEREGKDRDGVYEAIDERR